MRRWAADLVRLLERTLVSVAAMEGSVLVEASTGQRSSALMGNAVCWLELCVAAHRFRWFHALVMAAMTFKGSGSPCPCSYAAGFTRTHVMACAKEDCTAAASLSALMLSCESGLCLQRSCDTSRPLFAVIGQPQGPSKQSSSGRLADLLIFGLHVH